MTGDAPDAVTNPAGDPAGDPPAKAPDKRARSNRVEIDLEVSRGRSVGWMIFGLVVGALLIWQLGTVGVWAGFALVAAGLYHTGRVIQMVRYPAGTIVISDREVSLPRGLCMARPVVATPQDVTAVYFLRRSVPWNHASPVLVVELGARAMTFPRDWFASEADQRHVVHALLRDKPSTAVSVPTDDPAATP